MDVFFHAVGQPLTLCSFLRAQFPEVSVEGGPKVLNETPDAVMVMGTLVSGALFQLHIEGGRLHQKGLLIEITGTEGDLEVSDECAFVTSHPDVIRGEDKEASDWQDLKIQDRLQTLPSSNLDLSVQDLAQLYAAYARDRHSGTRSVRDFRHAAALHRLLDSVAESSLSNQTIKLQEHA